MYACIDLKLNTLTMSTTGHGQVYAYSNNVTIVHYYIACYVYDSCHHITIIIYGGFAFNSKRSKLVYVNINVVCIFVCVCVGVCVCVFVCVCVRPLC